jgi:hypothetical protein
MRTRNLVAASAITLVLVPAAAACGGSASADNTTAGASVTSQSGTTSAGAGIGGHTFATQITSLSGLVNRLSNISTSSGSTQVANAIQQVRQKLAKVRGQLATTTFPAVVQTQKQELMGFLDQWGSDLGQAQRTAEAGNTTKALQQAESSSYHDLKSLLATVQSATGG